MHLIQAIYLHDETAVRDHMAHGKHPGRFMQHCVTAKHRPDLLSFVLGFMSADSETDINCIERVKQHLEFIDRYPIALNQLKEWITTQNKRA